MSKRSIAEHAQHWLYEHGAGPKPKPPASFARHTRKCSVCRHPDRDGIEREFLRWHSPEDIARDYGIADHSSIYRHAHATGLFERRRATIRLALEPIIEQAASVEVTADAVIRAVQAYAHINDAGEWLNPPTHVVHHSQPDAGPSSATSGQSVSNRQIQELEHGPTH